MALSPEEWRRALALSGASNDTMDLLNGFGEQAPQNRPPVVQLPAETQQALEKTGSGYKLPSVEVGPIETKTRQPDDISRGNVPENPYGLGTGAAQPARMQLPEQEIQGDSRPVDRGGVPENPYPEQIGDRPFNPNVGSKRLAHEYNQGQNQSLNSISEQGGIAQQGLSREAELAGGLAQQRQGEIDQVRGRVDENRNQQHAFEQAAAARLDKISQMVDNPPDQSKGMVLRIIGAVIANSPKFNGGKGGSGGAGIGAGLNMIGQSMAGDIKGWHDEIAANRELHESLLAQSKNEQADSEHELRMTGALTDLGFGVYDAALKQVRAETQSEEVARASDELRNGLRQKYGQAQMEINSMRAKQQGAGKRDAEDRNILNVLASVPDAERPTRAMQLGPRALKLLADSQKNTANVIGMGKDIADTEKARADLAKDQGSHEVVPGFVDTIGLDPPTRAELRKNAVSTASIIEDLGKLRRLREKNGGGTFNQNDQQEAQTIMGAMSTKMSQMNGAGAPSESERELFMKSLTDPTGHYLFKDPTELYDRMAKSFRGNLESKMKAVGVVRQGATSGGGVRFTADPTPDGGKGGSGGW